MKPHANTIWEIADSMREQGEYLDPVKLIRQSKEAGIPIGIQEIISIIQRLGREAGEYFVPTDVAEFVAKLLEPTLPKTMLDPWAGMGLLTIPLNMHLRLQQCTAYSPNATACEVFRMIKGATGIKIECADPLLALAQSSEQYDAIAGNTPFGMRAREPLVVRVGTEEQKVSDDYGNLLILQSCLRLSENGLGVFIVPNSFFAPGGNGKARSVLLQYGFRVTAAIELPAGTFHPSTSLTTHIVVLQKSTDSKLSRGNTCPTASINENCSKTLLPGQRVNHRLWGDLFRGRRSADSLPLSLQREYRNNLAAWASCHIPLAKL